MNNELPSSFTTLFGPIDHADGNESRSVLSPAAYLVDLLELRDSLVSGWTDYHERRPDVRLIPLDQANTFTEIPFLDVANAVMGALVTGDVLAASLFPPPLPFSEQHVRLKLYAEKLGTSLDELQRLYRSSVDAHLSARLRLGLSQEEYALFTTAQDSDPGIKQLWGEDQLGLLDGSDTAGLQKLGLSHIELIKKKLGLSLKELKQLLRQDLSEAELAEPTDPKASKKNAAECFFINQGSNYIVLDEGASKLHLKDRAKLTNQHLDRMMRFVRLARRLDLELADLDWLIQTACGNVLDKDGLPAIVLNEDGLQAIAIALEIRKTTDMPTDEICTLWSMAKDHGQGDGPIPADLFSRVYNNDFPTTLEAFVGSLDSANATADELDDRLQATLRLSGADFAFLKAALLDRGVPQPQPPLKYRDLPVAGAPDVVTYFSAFRRIVTLSTMLSVSVQEAVMLLDVLGAQWTVCEHDDLTIPMPFSAAALPSTPIALLVQPDAPPRRTLDVLQRLFRVKQWLDLRQLSPRQLAYICLEDHRDARLRLDDGTPIDDVQPDDAIESTLDDLYESLHDAMLAPSALQTGSLTANGALAVFDSLRDARVLVTFDDQARSLLRVQPSDDELTNAMQQGIHERLEVHASDLAALGIADTDPLFSLLVSHGYLERVEETIDGELEVHYFIAPGLTSYFSPPKIPSFPALFSVLAQHVDAPSVGSADLAAAGITALDVPALFVLLQARGYVERIHGSTPAEYRIAAGAKAFFGDPASVATFDSSLTVSSGAATFTIPNFQAHAAELFSVLAQHVNAARVDATAVAATGIDTADVPALFEVLAAHGYVEPVPGSEPTDYRVIADPKPFFGDPTNLAKFVLPDFTTVFAVLAAKVDAFQRAEANLQTEAQDLGGRLAAFSDQQIRAWLRSLSGLIGLAEDLTELAFAWAFGTPDETMAQTLATLTLPLLQAKQQSQPALGDAYLASRFRRLQQVALLLRKAAMSADEARVFLTNQQVHRRLPETLKVPLETIAGEGFLSSGKIDALATLPNGDFLIVSGPAYAAFARQDYHPLERINSGTPPAHTGTLDQIPGVTLPDDSPDKFRTRVLASGLDAAFNDSGAGGEPVLHLVAGDRYVTVSEAGTSPAKPITDWGKVRNNIQKSAHVDAAVQAKDGRLFVFSGDQYFLYSNPQQLLLAIPAFVDERYPRSIRGKFENEGISPLPALMFSGVDAAFRDTDDTYFYFAGSRFSHSTDPYNVVKIRPVWGHVLNYLFEDDRVDAAFVVGGVTYLTRRNQLTRYTGSAYQFVDEGYPISFGNIADSEPLLRVLRRFPNGLDAALAGSDGKLYAFKDGAYASSAAPDTALTIRDHWGRVRNVFVDNQRVDAALAYNGVVYLFCGDQYVRYSGTSYEFVDEGYPRRVRPNWNALEKISQIPDALPLPITAVAVGRTPTGTTDDVYFFGGNQFAGPTGALDDIKAQWARVRNNIERVGVVDAAMVDGSGRMYLFSGDQYYRYSSPDQTFVDETYPRRLAGNWAQEGTGYVLPDAFASGISAALRTTAGNVVFFSGQSYARVDTAPATPRSNSQDWGVVRNVIQSQNVVSAAYVDPAGKTYVFGGDQFVRYTGTAYDFVDEGFPLQISTRWPSLPDNFRSDIDAALSFKSPVDNVQWLYLFKGTSYVRFSTGDLTQMDAGYPKTNLDAIKAEGLWFRGLAVHEPNPNSSHQDDPIVSVEAIYVDTFSGQPRINVFYRHEGGVQWRRIFQSGSWGAPVQVETVTDYQPFTRLDAAFVATDGTLHAFSGNQYASRPAAGGAFTAPVSIQSRWARVFNQFADLGRVDACLTMGDGRTYLFCAKQFIKYTGTLRPGAADFYVDEGYPLRIDPNWPAQGIPVTLAPEFQAAGYDLCRDASGKVHFLNGTRYAVSGTAGDVLLTSRWGKVENRFQALDRVDAAYRAENGKLYLFCDTQYTRYSGALQPGSPDFYADEGYPRHVTTGWASEGLPIVLPATWNALGSAIFRDAQQTYVFAGSSFTSSQSPVPAPVIPTWAKVRNQIQSQNRVDAGFVFGQGAGAVTLVFCDDQYVRYSGAYDGFVDEGYPKVIAHLAAADGAFPGLPADLQSGLRGLFAGTDGNLHAFGPQPPDAAQPQLYVSSASPGTLRPLNERWGIVENKLWDNEFVNAALVAGGKLFLFSGDQYVRYSGPDRKNVDEGYPRKIATSYANEIGATTLAPIMNQGIDATLTIGATTFYFVQDQVIASDHPDVAQPLVKRWGLVDNRLQASQKLDAAFVAPSGKLYLFAGSQVSVYSGANRQDLLADGQLYVDEEYPRTLATDLGAHWPHDNVVDFRSDLDAAAGFEGRSYLFKGTQHVRLSDFRLAQPDAGYPMNNAGDRLDSADHPLDIAGKFVDRFDFELGTLPDWWRIKQLFDDFSSQTTTVLDYLDDSPAALADVKTAEQQDLLVPGLSRATQWPKDEINALLAMPEIAAILANFSLASNVLLDGRALVVLARCFELAGRTGTTPGRLKSQVWNRAFGADASQLLVAADFLYGLIKVATSPKDRPDVARSLLDPVESAKRDALVAYLVENLQKPGPSGPEHLRDANELYEYLLTDVQMDASSTTSKIVEAINSIQLYYHRALIHLEDVHNDDVKTHLKAWWPWMKNYRIWEANRKVFLHPENYIRPELRKVKSPAFEELEQKLLQDEITAVTVEEGYQRYLESFNEIARLRIAGGYRYLYKDDAGADRIAVVMIGYARTSPPTYYYRRGSTTENTEPKQPDSPLPAIEWEPWQKMGITIDAEHVQLVYAFNKLFAFWVETTPFNDTSFKISADSNNSKNTYSADSEQSKQLKLTIKFSFYNFNNEWVPPQTVVANPHDRSDPESLPLDFEFPLPPPPPPLPLPPLRMGIPAAAIDSILLDARTPLAPVTDSVDEVILLKLEYLWWEWKGQITAGLDLEHANRFWRFRDFSLTHRSAKLPTQIGINANEVTAIVPWGSPENDTNQWLSFDAKGGSFLCRPTNTPKREHNRIKDMEFLSVSAAFNAGTDLFVFTSRDKAGVDTLCYFHYVASAQPPWQEPVFVDDPAWPWGRPRGVFEDPNKQIDNVVFSIEIVNGKMVDGKTYVTVGPQYFTYPSTGYGAIEQRYATELLDGPPALPDLVGGATPLPWQILAAGGSELVRAFKHVDGASAVLVTHSVAGFSYALFHLADLREFSKKDDTSPFDGWNGLDAVFWVSQPEPSAVFSRGNQLVILHWPSKQWSTGSLGKDSQLSTAFTGVDGKLYFFSGHDYSEANPADLGADQVWLSVATRWGRPSLFTWLVSSIDGAMIVRDGPNPTDKKLYLFCTPKDQNAQTYCLRYTNFAPTAVDSIRLDEENLPMLASELWISSSLGSSTIDVVTAAFERNGTAYLYGKRNLDHQPFMATYSDLVESPFAPDGGDTLAILGILGTVPSIFETAVTSFARFSTDFYAEILSADQSFAITRLTSHTSEQFSRRLFAGGIPELLSLKTQQLPELPRFTARADAKDRQPAADELIIDTNFVADYPGKSPQPTPVQPPPVQLDFDSANGFYYWEIFFHIPFLIAQALTQAQRFDEAKAWYEYVFDPTAGAPYWQFIEFPDKH